MPHLSQGLRLRLEADLRWYREARGEAADALAALQVLRDPTTAKLSYIGSAKGAPGNPTLNRAAAALPIAARARQAVWVVRAVDGWLWAPERRSDDRLLVALVYGLHRPERIPLAEAAAVVGVPCGTSQEARWLDEHFDGLLMEIARALKLVRREGIA